jgi:hypothetical protein
MKLTQGFKALVGYALIMLVLVVVAVNAADAQPVEARIAKGKDIYELWRGSPQAPLSIVVVKRCIRAEDSASHLELVSYSRSVVKLTCDPSSF